MQLRRRSGSGARLARLSGLANFILPGGTPAAADLHVARAVCRRAERRVTTLAHAEAVIPLIPAYLNRLADLLFVAARYVNHAAGIPDAVWSPAEAPEGSG